MPSIQRAQSARSRTGRSRAEAKPPFAFPSSHHLLITTPSHVLSHSPKTGLQAIFTSGSAGILGARCSSDGSRTLAVADSHNAILHRTEPGGQQRSYRLRGTEGHISLLEFSPDSRTLFFTTTLLDAVQAYSVPEARIIEPGPLHASPPTVMALSPSGHLLLTASERPPVVFLQNRVTGSQPLMLQPLASGAAVALAAYHPERPNVFLLGFRDGTVAAYDAVTLAGSVEKDAGNPRVVGGEVGVVTELHRVTTRKGLDPEGHSAVAEVRSLGVTGMAFLPGERWKAITCGADGRCRSVDFEAQTVLKSWHVRGPATALTILPSRVGKPQVIAVARQDAKVVLFDLDGTLLQEIGLQGAGERVIDVRWIKGPSPKGAGSVAPPKIVEETWIELFTVGGTLRSRRTRSSRGGTWQDGGSHDDKDPPKKLDATATTPELLPDEPSGTVQHRPGSSGELPDPAMHNYMDLFSPVKAYQPPSPPKPPISPRRKSTPRQRPRLSSSTFINRSATSPTALSPTCRSEVPQTSKEAANDAPSLQAPTQEQKKERVHFSREVGQTADPRSSQILTEIRQQSRSSPGKPKQPGTFALFAPYLPKPPSVTAKRKPAAPSQASPHRRTLSNFSLSPKKSRTDRIRDPRDVEKDIDARKGRDDDIWLTAESDDDDAEAGPLIHRTKRPTAGKPARRLMWPGDRAVTRSSAPSVPTGRTISLQMSAPISRLSLSQPHREHNELEHLAHGALALAPERRPSPPPLDPSATPSRTSASFRSLYDSDPDSGPAERRGGPLLSLAPGYAQSYLGPVKVQSYLPRKSSLAVASNGESSVVVEGCGAGTAPMAAVEDDAARERRALGGMSGRSGGSGGAAGARGEGQSDDEVGGAWMGEGCQCCGQMRAEMGRLRAEMEELRRLVKVATR